MMAALIDYAVISIAIPFTVSSAPSRYHGYVIPFGPGWLLHKRQSDTEFLERIWSTALGRRVDESGREELIYRMSRGTSRLILVEELLCSLEYNLRQLGDEAFCRHLYAMILSRDPHPDDTMTGWLDLVRQKGRRATFEAFCTSQEVQFRYAAQDAFELVGGLAGHLLVTFRRFEIHLTFGLERAVKPLVVRPASLPVILPVLQEAGFDALALRVKEYLEAPVHPAWPS